MLMPQHLQVNLALLRMCMSDRFQQSAKDLRAVVGSVGRIVARLAIVDFPSPPSRKFFALFHDVHSNDVTTIGPRRELGFSVCLPSQP